MTIIMDINECIKKGEFLLLWRKHILNKLGKQLFTSKQKKRDFAMDMEQHENRYVLLRVVCLALELNVYVCTRGGKYIHI